MIPFRILFKTDDAEATVGAGTAANAALAQTNEMNLAVRENDGFFNFKNALRQFLGMPDETEREFRLE